MPFQHNERANLLCVCAQFAVDVSLRETRRMPAPLPAWRREQIMEALAAGRAVSEIAEWLHVSRQTVWRYAQAAAQQGRAVPLPRPMGGYR